MSELALPPTLRKSHLRLQGTVYHGKVRDVYDVRENQTQLEFDRASGLDYGQIVMVATDRISAFDVELPRQIPHKGHILTQISWHMLKATSDIVPNWAIASPDPCVIIGQKCEPIKVEMVVRNFITGSWWRKYQNGERLIAGHQLRDGMKEFDRFHDDGPIITPTTKAEKGDHDEDISESEILDRGLCTKDEWDTMCRYSLDLFNRGHLMAMERGLLLVDTKYEFGRNSVGSVMLIDEVHTPDSSRYFYSESFDEIVASGGRPKQLSKEFVREWLMEQGFMGKEGQVMPDITDEFVRSVSDRYVELYQRVTGKTFIPPQEEDINTRIQMNVDAWFMDDPD